MGNRESSKRGDWGLRASKREHARRRRERRGEGRRRRSGNFDRSLAQPAPSSPCFCPNHLSLFQGKSDRAHHKRGDRELESEPDAASFVA
eukprot:763997-Hanusia_phi.AAC.9